MCRLFAKDSSKIKILVCCHKPCELPKDDIFLPIQVGAAISNVDLGMQRDDQVNGEPCDNISAKNKSYCELTAMYWAWKNIKTLYPDLEYIGLNHYRRYFAFKSKYLFCNTIFEQERRILEYKIDYGKLNKLLPFLILPKKRTYPYSLYIDYSISHISEDMRCLENIIHDISPEYDTAFSKIIMHNNKYSPCNMFIMRWDDFDRYCAWLFAILEEAEKRINISYYNSIQKRIFGYMAERLFNIWIYRTHKKTKTLPVQLFCEKTKNKSLLYFLLVAIRNKICFFLLKK